MRTRSAPVLAAALASIFVAAGCGGSSSSSSASSAASSASSALQSATSSGGNLESSASSALSSVSSEQSPQVSSALNSDTGKAAVAMGQDLAALLLGQGDTKTAANKLQSDYDGLKDQIHKTNSSTGDKLDKDVSEIKAAADAGDTAKVKALAQQMTQDLRSLIGG